MAAALARPRRHSTPSGPGSPRPLASWPRGGRSPGGVGGTKRPARPQPGRAPPPRSRISCAGRAKPLESNGDATEARASVTLDLCRGHGPVARGLRRKLVGAGRDPRPRPPVAARRGRGPSAAPRWCGWAPPPWGAIPARRGFLQATGAGEAPLAAPWCSRPDAGAHNRRGADLFAGAPAPSLGCASPSAARGPCGGERRSPPRFAALDKAARGTPGLGAHRSRLEARDLFRRPARSRRSFSIYDAVVLDPPRSGRGKHQARRLAEAEGRDGSAYVSCDLRELFSRATRRSLYGGAGYAPQSGSRRSTSSPTRPHLELVGVFRSATDKRGSKAPLSAPLSRRASQCATLLGFAHTAGLPGERSGIPRSCGDCNTV